MALLCHMPSDILGNNYVERENIISVQMYFLYLLQFIFIYCILLFLSVKRKLSSTFKDFSKAFK